MCNFPDCKRDSLPYKQKNNSNRHKKSHEQKRRFKCTVLECNNSFTREDKLRDHIRAGHDYETIFACPQRDCQALLTKDLMCMHTYNIDWPGNDLTQRLRQCPLLKCSFYVRYVRFSNSSGRLDTLRQQLLDNHDIKGRKRFASLLADRRYHHESADKLCPICPDFSSFKSHEEFRIHFLVDHCSYPNMPTELQLRVAAARRS